MSARRAELEPIADCWQRALDADYRALTAVDGILPHAEIGPRLCRLAQERREAELLLRRLARMTGSLQGPREPAGFPQRRSGSLPMA